jgi:hypothetical protein
MSLYALQKLIRDVNRRPPAREAFFQTPEKFGALAGRKGAVVAYEAVKPWATGVGMMSFPAAA